MRPSLGLTAICVSAAFASTALAQDMATVGDWRHIGETPSHVFAWDMNSRVSSGQGFMVRMMSAPLNPAAGAPGVDYTIAEVQVHCPLRMHVIVHQQSFHADATPASAVRPARDELQPPHALKDNAGTPVEAFFPFVCEGRELPAPGIPGEAAEMARAARGYIQSGAADGTRTSTP